MKRYIYSAAVVVLAFACSRIEEVEPEKVPVAVKMQLAAMMDAESAVTKTYLDGIPVASVRNTWWLPDDKITVIGTDGDGRFDNICTDTTEIAFFEGLVNESESYYAIYPSAQYNAQATSLENGTLGVVVPELQYYASDRFHTDMVPMVTEFQDGDSLYFRNICGGFVFKLTGTEIIKSISFVAYAADGTEAKISGTFAVDMNSESLAMTPAADAKASVSVYCGDGIQLNEIEPTAFHIVLPPAVYKGFKISVVSTDGLFMNIKSEKDLNIRRANITYAPSLEFNDNIEPIDLSALETANSYMVTEAGVYSFDAAVIGNGMIGLSQNTGFHTADPAIFPEYVEVLWTDKEDVISDVKLLDGRVRFIASGVNGNALIAVKDASGVILWSWHIWSTEKPNEQAYVTSSGTYMVLDRNLGSVRTEAGMDSGLYYQWGRKDPFSFNYLEVKKEGNAFSIETALSKPTVMSTNHYVEYQSSERDWMDPVNDRLWQSGMKTIYDPCPAGYKVVSESAFAALTGVPKASDNGYVVSLNETDSVFFPISYFWSGRGNQDAEANSYTWTSLYGRTFMINEESAEVTDRFKSSPAVPVRCMKDESLNLVFGQIDIRNITASSASVSAVLHEAGEVVERGFVYGLSADVNVDTGTKIICEAGEMSAELTELSESEKYYVRMYVTRPDRTLYSSPVSFVTPGADGVYDLSLGGTSNSYIVSVPGSYRFKATVKGNSTEKLEYAEYASVLWETLNTDNMVEVGDVITDVAFDGTYITFRTPAELVPGNALVAVRDDEDKILWSWHLWVTDQNPESAAIACDNGYMIMDRNLGALTNDINDVRSFGLFYQWGRKDPFVGCGNIEALTFALTAPANAKKYVKNGSDTDLMSYAVSHPTAVIQDSKWNLDNTLWGSVKTMYDPCPVGWRVADFYALFTNEMYSPPYPGYTNSTNELVNVSTTAYTWTVNQESGFSWGCSYVSGKDGGLSGSDVHKELNVRCIKDADYKLDDIVVSDIAAYTVKLSAEVIVSDATSIEKRGFVINSSNDLMLGDEGVTVVASTAGNGKFSETVSGLDPNRKYYARAYAVGGYNTKYGETIEFTTDSSGNGEDFKDGGDYEWE